MNAIFIAAFLFILPWTLRAETPEEQVLEVVTKGGSVLSEPLIALTQDGKTFLPLQDMAKTLGVRTEQKSETVFLIYYTANEYQTLDLSTCFRPQADAICAQFIRSQGVIYASTDYLEKNLSWPLTIDVKRMQIIININPSADRIPKKTGKEERPLQLKRGVLGYPALHVEGDISTPQDTHTVSLYGVHALLDHDSRFFYYTKDDYSRLRWTLGRQSFDDHEHSLSPKNYELVSTLTSDIKYLFSPTPIIGVNVSNRRFDENVFDTHNIYEKGPPRWKVELTVNGIYLGDTYVDAKGNFSFLDVPLFYGENTLAYRFTSPLGKTLEYSQIYSVSAEFEGAKRLRYQLSFGQVEEQSEYMGSAQVNYGVTSAVSVQAGAAQFTLDEELKKYSLLGLSLLQPFYSVSVIRTASMDGQESANTLAPKINFPGVLVSSEYTEFNEFRSLLINKTDSNKQVSLGKVSALSQIRSFLPITIQIQAEEDRYENSLRTQEVVARAYAMFAQRSLMLETSKAWPSTGNPDLYIEIGDYHSTFRGKYGVLIQNDRYAKAKIGLEAVLPYELFFSANIDSPPDISETAYTAGLSKPFEALQVETLVSGSSSRTQYSLILSTNIKSNAEGVRFSSDESYLQGQMRVLVFVDENANGQMDPQEKPLSRVRILHMQRQKEFETDAFGRVVIPNINPYQRITLEVVKESITNIFLTARDFDNDFMLAPGQQLDVQIPVVPSFDVRGKIHNSYYKKLVPLDLVDNSGKIVASTVSSANGSFRFDDVASGLYGIKVADKFLQENDLMADPSTVMVDVTGKAGVKIASPFSITKSKRK